MRGPHPKRQRHRAAEPAAEGLRAEPDLVRDRRAGLRAARLDPDARADRDRPPLGTQAAPAAHIRRCRASGPQRTAPAAPPRGALALGRAAHHRSRPPAGPPVRLVARTATTSRKENTRDRGTPPTRRDSRAARHEPTLKTGARPAPQVTTARARKIEANGQDPAEPQPFTSTLGRAPRRCHPPAPRPSFLMPRRCHSDAPLRGQHGHYSTDPGGAAELPRPSSALPASPISIGFSDQRMLRPGKDSVR